MMGGGDSTAHLHAFLVECDILGRRREKASSHGSVGCARKRGNMWIDAMRLPISICMACMYPSGPVYNMAHTVTHYLFHYDQ